MDFARKQLEKYGWSDGKGLGKHENGISEALKPKLKRSVAGIGHDLASDFTEHWWTQLYNKAASNVQVEDKNGRTKKIKTKDNNFKITNSTWRIKQRPRQTDEQEDSQDEYTEYFVKTAVLTNGVSKTEKVKGSESEDEGIKDVFKITDEDLFAACEGRTAHKGARHGLRALGKLARIERQEKMLLTQPQYNGYSHAKKIKKQELSLNDLQVVEDLNLNSDADAVQTRKKKKKRKRCVSNASSETVNNTEEVTKPLPKKREIKKSSKSDTSKPSEEIRTAEKSSKSKRKLQILNEEEINEFNSKHKIKKNNKITDTEIVTECTNNNCGDLSKKMKKIKRKHLKDNET